MALRDKLRERSQPLLEPGEQIHEVYMAQTGPSPWFFLLTWLIFFAIKRRVVVVTDRAIVVFDGGTFAGTKPRGAPLARLPRTTIVGPVSGLWAKIELGGERMWVHKRFHGDIQRADAASTGGAFPAPGPGPGPGSPLPPPSV